MKVRRSAVVTGTAALVWLPCLWADFDPAHWQFRRPIQFATTGQALALIQADPVLYQGSAECLSDVRIVRDNVEVPYLLQTMRGMIENRDLQATIINESVDPGVGLQLTLDLGAASRHDRIRIETSRHNFRQRVRVETSDDDRQWFIAREDGSIFDFSEPERHASQLIVDYPVSTRRYVRLTVFGWFDVKAIDSAWLTWHFEHPDTRVTSAPLQKLSQVNDGKAQVSDVTIDIGYAGLPHDQLVLDVGPGLFSRAVQVDGSADGKQWQYYGQGTIRRTANGESLTISFSEEWDRYLRVRIWNHDDQPLVVRGARLVSLVRNLRFPAAAGGRYWIYYGNAEARQPAYDLATILPNDPAPAASMGLQENNPLFRVPSKPVSDRYPILLYTLLAVAILAMGYVTVKFLMKVQANG